MSTRVILLGAETTPLQHVNLITVVVAFVNSFTMVEESRGGKDKYMVE